MKYPREGDNKVWILDEPKGWLWYWEHYNPGGYPFPCTNETDTCPGCTSDIEKMKSVSRKVAFNAYDGEYTNVWKVPKTVAEKLETRADRRGTITDRPYLITQIKTKVGNKTQVDYDLEALDPGDMDINMTECEEYKKDPETYLAQAFEDAWGDDAKVRSTTQAARDNQVQENIRAKIQRAVAIQKHEEATPTEPPAWAAPGVEKTKSNADNVVSEEALRKMDPWDLAKLCKEEGFGEIPTGVDTPDDIVDWMLSVQ